MFETVSSDASAIAMKSVVIATDFLESSRLALDYGVAFARYFGAKLTLVHAIELSSEAREVELRSKGPSLSRSHALSRLEALAAGIRRLGMSVETDLRDEDVCSAVLNSAHEKRADLLVLGSHGIYQGLEHLVIGSNAEKMLLSATCPTLTVGRHVLAGIDLNLNFNRIIFISDLSPESISAAEYAKSLAQTLKVEVQLLQTETEDDSDRKQVDSDVERYCSELNRRSIFADHEWVDPAYHLQRMTPASEIIEEVEGCTDGLLILGVHKQSRWMRHLHSSFAFELVSKSSCPVLSVHGNESETT